MARIRSIHPGLFSDEAFMTLTIERPLCIPLLIGLWTEADDDGVFEWKPLTIKAKVLPAASPDINELLAALVDLDFIMKYEANGKAYGAIRNFKKWQRPKQPKVKHPKTETASTYVGMSGEAVPHGLPTGGENSPQREEVGGRREEGEETETNVSGAVAPVVSLDARTALFREGLDILSQLTGKPQSSLRGVVGKWLKQCGDDCSALLATIRRAAEVRPAEPVAWIERALRPKDPDAEIYRGVL